MSDQPFNKTKANITLLVSTLAMFLIPFMGSATNVALPTLGEEFSLDIVALGWVSMAFMLPSSALLMPFGKLTDMYGNRKILLLGMFIFLIGSVMCGFANSGGLLMFGRVVQGFGGAGVFTTAISVVANVFPLSDRGRVLGITSAAAYGGLSIGPALGGFATEYLGWRSIFYFTVILALIALVLAFRGLDKDSQGRGREKFDYVGTILYTASMVIAMYGVSMLPDMIGIWFIVAGLIIGGVFIWWQTKTATPLINLNLFKNNRCFSFSNLSAMVHYSGTWSVTFLLSLYLQYSREMSAAAAGLVLISSPIIQAIFSPIFGKLSDRIEPKILASVGMGITAVGIAGLVFIPHIAPIWYIIICLVVLGFGFALFSSPNTNAVMSSVDRRYFGFASASISTARNLGMMMSMGISWGILAVVVGRVEITTQEHAALTSAASIAFMVFAALCTAAIFISASRGNIHQAENKQ